VAIAQVRLVRHEQPGDDLAADDVLLDDLGMSSSVTPPYQTCSGYTTTVTPRSH